MVSLTLALMLLLAPGQDGPVAATADPEAAAMAELHQRAAERCETDPRADGETIEACAQRRVRALLDTYGSTAGALGAAARWRSGQAPAGLLGFATLDQALAADPGPAVEPASAPTPARPRCRRETERSEDGTSVSATLICGNGGEAERSAREMLDRLMQP